MPVETLLESEINVLLQSGQLNRPFFSFLSIFVSCYYLQYISNQANNNINELVSLPLFENKFEGDAGYTIININFRLSHCVTRYLQDTSAIRPVKTKFGTCGPIVEKVYNYVDSSQKCVPLSTSRLEYHKCIASLKYVSSFQGVHCLCSRG